MANLSNVEKVRFNGSDVTLIKLNGSIIYQQEEATEETSEDPEE